MFGGVRAPGPVGAEFPVLDVVVHDVPVGDEQVVAGGADRLEGAPAAADGGVVRGQMGALGAGGGLGGLGERGFQPDRAVPGARGSGFASGGVVAGADSGPGGQVRGAGKDAHVRALLGQQADRGLAGDAGNGHHSLQDRLVVGDDGLDPRVQVGEGVSRKSTWASIWATRMPWWATWNSPASASCSAGILLRSRPLASSANSAGSLIPASNASRIARPDLVSRVEATLDSLMPASWSTFSSRWITRVRSSMSTRRWRVRSRSSRIGAGGTKLGATSPCSSSWAIQAESATSVLRPGTLCRCSALSSQTCGIRSSSRKYTGFQYTPVDSMPPRSTSSPPSQSPSAVSPAVVGENVSVFEARPPPGRGRRTGATTVSRCTSRPAQRSTS